MPKLNPDDLMELIKGRRSIRKWLDKAVEEEKVRQTLVAGMYAPSACNSQKARALVVRDRDLIAEICQNVVSWFKKSWPEIIIAVLFDLEKPHPLGFDFTKPHPWSRFIWQDTAAAMMNMMLMAETLGLKTCWVSIKPPEYGNQEKEIRELLQIPDKYKLTCLLFLGYSDQKVDINTHKHYWVPIKRNEEEFIL